MDNIRKFKLDDMVVYKPYEGCNKVDVSKPGRIIEVLDDNFYKVMFGLNSVYGTRTGKYHWTKLYSE